VLYATEVRIVVKECRPRLLLQQPHELVVVRAEQRVRDEHRGLRRRKIVEVLDRRVRGLEDRLAGGDARDGLAGVEEILAERVPQNGGLAGERGRGDERGDERGERGERNFGIMAAR
jgi:hypothetical protein